ncbi:MAG TPA: hypothetical protein ENI23_02350 [bacterium]|nr:hypothetical protein [bacterium]
MEEIKLDGEEWAVDEVCIVHAAGAQFQVSIKKAMAEKLKLEARDKIKIYAKKVGHADKAPRKVNNSFNKTEPEEVAYP